MSRVRPILFGTEMVRAILDGRKTVTRRVAKKIPVETHRVEVNIRPDTFLGVEWKEFECHWGGYQSDIGSFVDGACIVKPPCQPGDILYVRETWTFHANAEGGIIFKARCPEKLAKVKKWRPSIHMPREAARIWLKVTDVRVERLQDITEEQAQKEGCEGKFVGTGEAMGSGWDVTPVDEFSELWDTTIKPKDRVFYGWAANPWVWVIEFEPCEKPDGWPE